MYTVDTLPLFAHVLPLCAERLPVYADVLSLSVIPLPLFTHVVYRICKRLGCKIRFEGV